MRGTADTQHLETSGNTPAAPSPSKKKEKEGRKERGSSPEQGVFYEAGSRKTRGIVFLGQEDVERGEASSSATKSQY